MAGETKNLPGLNEMFETLNKRIVYDANLSAAAMLMILSRTMVGPDVRFAVSTDVHNCITSNVDKLCVFMLALHGAFLIAMAPHMQPLAIHVFV